MITSICTIGTSHSVRDVGPVQSEVTQKKMLLRSGTGGLTMGEYMSKELFLRSMGLTGDETKYGNRDAEHQRRSYSTYMSYEIMDSVEDSIVEDVVSVRHGRWKKNGALLECQCCGEIYSQLGGNSGKAWNYCPDCGAKMDGGADHAPD